MACLQIILGGEATPSSDMWSLGCLFSLILLHRPLFDAKNAKQLMEHIYRTVGSYENMWKPGINLPLYDHCKPQRHKGCVRS